MTLPSLRRSLAILSALALLVPSLSMALPPAQLRGRVVLADGQTPGTGVTVVLVDASGEARYRSLPTTERGAFRIPAAEAGSYRLLAETADGAFLAPQPVSLRAGTTRAVSLALTPGQVEPPPEPPPADPEPAEPAPETPPDPPAPAPPEPAAPMTGSTGASQQNWRKWVIVGGMGVAALLVINEMGNEDEASPF